MDSLKFIKEIEYIENLREADKLEWKEIRNKFGEGNSVEANSKLKFFKEMSVFDTEMSVEEWAELVDYLMNIELSSNVIKLGES
ncbi:MAG: hypothetical protein RR603_05460, partial [Kurthia sp.]